MSAREPLTDKEIVKVAFALAHTGHDGIPSAPAGVKCPRCESERALERLALAAEPQANRHAQTIRGALRHGQGLGGHNNYRAAEEALAALEALRQDARALRELIREALTKSTLDGCRDVLIDALGEADVDRAEDARAERDPFDDGALERLARSSMGYYRTHGHYVPPLAQRLLDARAANAALTKEVEEQLAGVGEARPAEPQINSKLNQDLDLVGAPAEEQPDARRSPNEVERLQMNVRGLYEQRNEARAECGRLREKVQALESALRNERAAARWGRS